MSGSKAQHYPPQTGSYAVKVKNGSGWQGSSACRLHISVGQEYHEGEKLKATFNWVSHRFERVIICVNDTLQRYNFRYQGHSSEDAYRLAEQAGSEWISRNLAEIQNIDAKVEIFRWEDWTEHPDFKRTLQQVTERYDYDKEFKDTLDSDVLAYWERNSLKGSFEDFKKLSTKYYLEETAAFFIMYDEETATNIYPGSTLLPNKFHPNDGGFTRIDFKRNRQPEIA